MQLLIYFQACIQYNFTKSIEFLNIRISLIICYRFEYVLMEIIDLNIKFIMAHRKIETKHLTAPSFGGADNSDFANSIIRKSISFSGECFDYFQTNFCNQPLSSNDSNLEGQETPNFKSIREFDPFDKLYPKGNITLSTEECEIEDRDEHTILALQELLNFKIDDISSIYDNSDLKLFSQDRDFRACGCKLF